jgi:proline iminopeptidase
MRGIGVVAVVAAACGASSAPPVAGAHRAGEVAYDVRGHGKPCIVIPGGPGLDHRYLQSEVFESRFTAVYVDLPGTGASSHAPPLSRARDVAAVEQVRQALGRDRVCVLGHSAGGFVALEYALAHPEHVETLILLDTSPTTGPDFGAQIATNLTRFEHEPFYADATKALEDEGTATTQQGIDAVMQRELPLYFADWSARADVYRAAFRGVHLDLARDHAPDPPFDVRAKLSGIHARTLVVAGDRDFICGPTVAHWLEAIPQVTIAILPHTGHFGHLENPEALGRALDDFLGR